jgi:hypothetical protein
VSRERALPLMARGSGLRGGNAVNELLALTRRRRTGEVTFVENFFGNQLFTNSFTVNFIFVHHLFVTNLEIYIFAFMVKSVDSLVIATASPTSE